MYVGVSFVVVWLYFAVSDCRVHVACVCWRCFCVCRLIWVLVCVCMCAAVSDWRLCVCVRGCVSVFCCEVLESASVACLCQAVLCVSVLIWATRVPVCVWRLCDRNVCVCVCVLL